VTPRDEIWVDMTQFDTEVADAVWDGTHRDRSAPPWYRDVRALIHRARGPAEAHELADEPAVIEAMGRTARGQHLAPTHSRARATRPSGVHTLGRVVAMKAAAATTATLIGVTAAAAATTGIVATVAATVVVPAVRHHVVPFIGDRLDPTIVDGTGRSGAGDGSETHGSQVTLCDAGDGDDCGTLDPTTAGAGPPDASAPAEMPVAADPSPAQSPADEIPPVEQNPVVTEAESAEPEPAADATVEEAPATTEPLDATTVEPAPLVDPAPDAGTAPEPGPGDENEAPGPSDGKGTVSGGDHAPEQGSQRPATGGSLAGD
jgi:hypothetical protein